MTFSCDQDKFSTYLNIVSRVITGKHSMPILNNILITTDRNSLILTATDLELTLNCKLDASITDKGKVTVPGKQLAEYISSLPTETITATLDGSIFKVTGKNNVAEFSTIPVEDFPTKPSLEVSGQKLFSIKKEDLLAMVNRVTFATSKDSVKPVLTGVFVEVLDASGKISFVGADNLRLARQLLTASSIDSAYWDSKLPKTFLIPAKAFDELAFIVNNLGEDFDDSVDFYLSENKKQIIFSFNGVNLMSRLLEGQYPDYKAIIPTGYQLTVEFEKEAFVNALKITNIIARNIAGNKVLMQFDTAKSLLTLSASLEDIGSNESSLPIKAEGQDLKIALNGRSLGDFFSRINEDIITFEGNTAFKPGVFKIKDDSSYLYLVAPMMI